MENYKLPLEVFNCKECVPYHDEAFTERTKKIIQDFLSEYKIQTEFASVFFSPAIVTFNFVLDKAVSPKRVLALRDDLGLKLGVNGIRCYPNYEDGVISIEVPNVNRSVVELGALLQDKEMQTAKPTELKIALGKDMRNRTVIGDLSKMIHTLVAGASGSGKSVFLHSVIASLLYKHSPQDLHFILIDPKKVEFSPYEGLPHLITGKPITDTCKSIEALDWTIAEMNRRYRLLDKMSGEGTYVVNVDQYNKNVKSENERLPKIVIIIDELADLILASKNEVESRLQTIAQKARAAGIYLIVATQRPSADVVTGVVKANLHTRIAFRVSEEISSRMVLDYVGAEKLCGSGDYLYSRPGMGGVERMQAPCIFTQDILNLVDYVKKNYPVDNDKNAAPFIQIDGAGKEESINGADPLYVNALKMVIQSGTASISMIQRKCSIGYNKAGQIIEWMEENGYISVYDGARARKIFITMDEFEEKYGEKRVDPEYIEALKFVIEEGRASISILQRKLGMTLNKASKIVDWMEKSGYVSALDGKNPRKILITDEEFRKKFGK